MSERDTSVRVEDVLFILNSSDGSVLNYTSKSNDTSLSIDTLSGEVSFNSLV